MLSRLLMVNSVGSKEHKGLFMYIKDENPSVVGRRIEIGLLTVNSYVGMFTIKREEIKTTFRGLSSTSRECDARLAMSRIVLQTIQGEAIK